MQRTERVRAIETQYAGHRFRSRLEARWAVFFNTLGIKWHYEEEGYELPSGRYLPDFRLESGALIGQSDLWVEVKGRFSHRDFIRTIRAAIELPSLMSSPVVLQPKLLILGNIPRPPSVSRLDLGGGVILGSHIRLDALGGNLVIQQVIFLPVDYVSWHGAPSLQAPDSVLKFTTRPIGDSVAWDEDMLAQLCHLAESETESMRRSWAESIDVSSFAFSSSYIQKGYEAARSARFEFGENG
jgi:hypothetical protein